MVWPYEVGGCRGACCTGGVLATPFALCFRGGCFWLSGLYFGTRVYFGLRVMLNYPNYNRVGSAATRFPFTLSVKAETP